MKKGKILSADGSEFTVFYLKNDENQPELIVSENLNEMDVNENSAGSQTFAEGKMEQEDGSSINIKIKGMIHADDLKDEQKEEHEKIKEILQKDLDNYLASKKSGPNKDIKVSPPPSWMPFFDFQPQDILLDDTAGIDDTIESDIVREPVIGELYRVRMLNKIARFKGHSTVEGVHTKRYFYMSHHGQEFHVPNDCLIKAREEEALSYGGKL